MKSAHTTFARKLIAAAMLAGFGFASFAQTATPPAPAPQARGEQRHHMDPAKVKAFVAKRQAELKAKLKITPAQEGAWSTYTAAHQPPADVGQRPSRADFEKLTTPQRIDKMREMQAKRSAEMDKRAESTKTFYAALTPEQQKVFDANAMRRHGDHHHRDGGRPGTPPAKG